MDKIRGTRGHGRVGSVACFSRFRGPAFVSACHAAGARGLEPARIDQPAGPVTGVLRGDAVGQEQMPPQQLGFISVQSSIATGGKGTGCDDAMHTGMSKFYPHTVYKIAHTHYEEHNFPVFCEKSFGPEIAIVFMCQTARVLGVSIDGTHAQRLGRLSRFRRCGKCATTYNQRQAMAF